MKLVIFGASGRTGQELVKQALARGHTVTAAVRQPTASTVEHPQLTVVRVDFGQADSVAAAITGHDAVLSAIGAPMNRAPTSVHNDSARAISVAMQATSVRRWICVTSGGTNPQHDPNLPFVFEQVFKRLFATIYEDQIAMEQTVMASKLDWTIARPAALTDDQASGRYRTAEAFAIRGGNRTPRADLAAWMLDALDMPTTIHKAVAIAL